MSNESIHKAMATARAAILRDANDLGFDIRHEEVAEALADLGLRPVPGVKLGARQRRLRRRGKELSQVQKFREVRSGQGIPAAYGPGLGTFAAEEEARVAAEEAATTAMLSPWSF